MIALDTNIGVAKLTHMGVAKFVESSIEVRPYRSSDYIGEIAPEFAHLELDPENVWVAIRDLEVVGVLLIAYGNQTAFLLRLVAVQDAPLAWVALLLRRAIADLEERGCVMLISCLSTSTPQELKLISIFKRAGGTLLPVEGYMAGVSIENARKW